MSFYRRQPKKLDDALLNFFDSIPNKAQIKRAIAVTHWQEIVGEKIALQTKELKYEGTKLIVFMENSLWRHEVHAQRFTILNKLNQSVNDKVISELIIK